MKSISKKVLGLLICSSVILSSLSIGAYAESSDAGTANYEVAYSGMVDLNTDFGGSSLSASAYSGTYYDQLSTDEQEMYNKITRSGNCSRTATPKRTIPVRVLHMIWVSPKQLMLMFQIIRPISNSSSAA